VRGQSFLRVPGGSTLSGSVGNGNSSDIDLDVKPKVDSPKLQNLINSLYKGQGNPNQIGNGTTMDAIRYEFSTGNLVEGKSQSNNANGVAVWCFFEVKQRKKHNFFNLYYFQPNQY